MTFSVLQGSGGVNKNTSTVNLSSNYWEDYDTADLEHIDRSYCSPPTPSWQWIWMTTSLWLTIATATWGPLRMFNRKLDMFVLLSHSGLRNLRKASVTMPSRASKGMEQVRVNMGGAGSTKIKQKDPQGEDPSAVPAT